MAFTDPIVAGDELVRAAIQSANYVQGSAGWRVARNGAAEFDVLALRNSLSVPSISLAGKDLATLLNARALGCIAWNGGSPTTSTTTQAGIIYTEADMIAGRMYEIAVLNITPDMGSVDGTEYHLRWVQGTAAWPTNASTLLSMSLRLSQFKLGIIRSLFQAPATDRFRFRASIVSLDGATVRNWSGFGAGCQIFVNDLGIGPAPNGSVGPNPPGVSLREFTIEADNVKSWGNSPGYATSLNALVQSDYDGTNGAWLGWWTFDAAARAQLDDLIGVASADILTCEVYLSCGGWYGSNGTAILGYHNTTSLGAGLPAGGQYNKLQILFPGAVAGWINLRSTASIMNAIIGGTLEGFLLGNPGENNETLYGGVFAGTGADRPKLHVKYYK